MKFLIQQWYADHAKILLDRRISIYAEKILGKGFGHIQTRYKFMKRRWGSYDPQRGLAFNIELVKAPMPCVEYVIVHELCHVVSPNHDKVFYRLLAKVLPDWGDRKERLELFGVR